MTQSSERAASHAVAPVFIERWSPRSFAADTISDSELFTLFEAARWAPSGNNSQPWRFIYAKRDSASWTGFLNVLNEKNRLWASKASALVILVTATAVQREGEAQPSPLRNHALDAGAAWISLALQAQLSGWKTHGIGGFDKEAARQQLGIPEHYQAQLAIAIGKQGLLDELAEEFQPREKPNQRLPLSALVAEGRFSFS